LKINFTLQADEFNPGDIGEYAPPTHAGVLAQSTSTGQIFIDIANNLVTVVTVAAVIGIIISGIIWASATGDEEKISKAKRYLKWSIIGLVVALVSFSVVRLVVSIFVN
jgi:cytochrome bd-type quinol oxidase subunit 2